MMSLSIYNVSFHNSTFICGLTTLLTQAFCLAIYKAVPWKEEPSNVQTKHIFESNVIDRIIFTQYMYVIIASFLCIQNESKVLILYLPLDIWAGDNKLWWVNQPYIAGNEWIYVICHSPTQRVLSITYDTKIWRYSMETFPESVTLNEELTFVVCLIS